MPDAPAALGTLLDQAVYLPIWIDTFLTAKRAEGLAPGSLKFYRIKLANFANWCDGQAITSIEQITAGDIRQFLLYLGESHNPGGVHAHYRAVKALLRFYELEAEPEGWRNPIRKVKAPKVPDEPLEPVSAKTLAAMLKVSGARDRAIILALLDTGARLAEFLAMDLGDIDLITGAILIRKGKGGKSRTVYLGKKSRRALRAYLRKRSDVCPAVWVSDEGERLAESSLRSILVRRAKDAGVKAPTPHDFRRAFAINMLRNGCDLVSLSRLMGHSNLSVLQRYLKQLPDDLQAAHRRAGPVDSGDFAI